MTLQVRGLPVALTLAMTLSLGVLDPPLGHAQDPGLLTLGPRIGVGGDSPLGEEQKENFEQFDIAATFVLPWGWHGKSGWGLETRFIASAGELRAAGISGFMGTLVPDLAVSAFNGGVTIDVGLGAGFFGRHKYGVQNFGGPVQIIATTGIGFLLHQTFFAGYRFQHFSDATVYGSDSLGADMHLTEVSYLF